MGYTLDQLEAMGAKPVSNTAPAPQSPVDSPVPSAPKKKYTLQELQAQGAKAVSAAPTVPVPEQKPKTDWLGMAAKVTDAISGAGKVGEYIGTKIAEKNATEEEKTAVKQFNSGTFDTPTGKEIAGSVAQAGVNFLPVGRIAGAATKVASKALPFLGKKGASFAGKVAAGGGTGYAYDAASGYAQGEEDPTAPGAGAVIGAGIPFIPPALRGVGRLASEGLGISTGTGQGVIKQGMQALTQGGESAKGFRDAMRGNVAPEEIVDEARGALGQIIRDRTNTYRSQLADLKTNVKEFKTDPVVEKFNKMLDEYGVTFGADGTPDFLRSPGLGRYEKDLLNLSKVLQTWGSKAGDNTVVGIDTLKQVIDDFRIGSGDSRKFDAFVTALRNEAKDIIKDQPGYKEMVGAYEQSTGLIKEIQRGLSLGDKAQADTAFRKLTGVLRTNNEFRKQLADELNEITGGTLLPKVAGQQMSELAPRGLSRVITPALGVGGAFTGIGIIPILQAALFTSPRAVGEILSVLGFAGEKANKVMKLIAPQGIKAPGDMVLDKFQQ